MLLDQRIPISFLHSFFTLEIITVVMRHGVSWQGSTSSECYPSGFISISDSSTYEIDCKITLARQAPPFRVGLVLTSH